MYLKFQIKVPAFIESIILYFLLRCRKKHYGVAFRRIKLITSKDVDIKYQYAIVSPEDYQKLSQQPWQLWETESNKCYAVQYFGKKIIYMHRQIMNAPCGKIVDHKDRNGLNNTKQNLRLATRSQNNCNTMHRRGSSKYRGVSREKETGKWKCKICFNGICIYLGLFEAEEDAAKAYDEAAKIYHGEFAVLNFPQVSATCLVEVSNGRRRKPLAKTDGNTLLGLTTKFWYCICKEKGYNFCKVIKETKKFKGVQVMKKVIAICMILLAAAVVVAVEKAKTEESAATVQQKQAAQKANLPLEKTIELGNEVNIAVIFIPAGEFDMGSPMDELKRDSDEAQHHIKLTKAFYIGKFEVTQLQYRVIMSENPSKFGGDKLPVENVNWDEAQRFLKKLSDKTGMKFRLPSEAEWEYACRAGTKTAFNTGTTLDSDFANYDASTAYADGIIGADLKRTTAVGSYPPNAFGLCDMHGNVWEWCGDVYDNEYYKVTPLTDPKGPADGKAKVIRGGAWNEPPYKCRSADRNHRWRNDNQPIIGFRVVMEIEEKP
jgi:formylglycine-generating enzyme required for sulfatase activity